MSAAPLVPRPWTNITLSYRQYHNLGNQEVLGNWNNLLESNRCLGDDIGFQFFEGADWPLEEVSSRLEFLATPDIPYPLESVHARCRAESECFKR
jgi:hypothetical protein